MQNRLQTPASTSHIGGQSMKRCSGRTRKKGMESCDARCAMCDVVFSGSEDSHIPNDKPPGRSVPPCGFS